MTMLRRVLQLRAASARAARLSPQLHASAPVPTGALAPRPALSSARSRRQTTAALFSSQAAATATDAVETLKALCNALRNDLHAAPPADASVAAWRERVALLAGDAALELELRRAYESGVAIATKQRQFALAQALVDQMQGFGLAPSAATFQYLIRGVALDLLARPMSSADDLRALMVGAGASWEREMLAIVRAEEYPHYRKTPKERALFRQRLVEGVEAQLDAFERAHRRSARKGEPLDPLPFNEALRTYADNGVPFPQMLRLMVQRTVLPDVDTYAALLQGARWTEIPATISQLLQSSIVDALSAPAAEPAAAERQSHHVHLLWTNAMKAVVHSFTDHFADRSAHAHRQELDELQKVFAFVDKQLGRAFPKFRFATRAQHDEVYALRAKAAATCGLHSSALKVLDEYVALAPAAGDGAPLSKSVFLCALELFTWSQLEIINLSRNEVRERSTRRDVSTSRHVAELERLYERVLKHSAKRKQQRKTPQKTQLDAASAERVFDSASESSARLSRHAVELAQRLALAREHKSWQLLVQEQFERADASMAAVLDKLEAATGGDKTANDLDVALKLMEQYMTCATRYETRLGERRQDVSPQVMRRVFRVVKEATAARGSGELSGEERAKLHELLLRAIRTAVLFWRAEDVDKLVRKKKRVLGVAELDTREYDLLIFQRVATRDTSGAYALLEEVHNAGKAPSKDALHRIALSVLHKLHKYPGDQTSSSAGVSSGASDGASSGASDGASSGASDDQAASPPPYPKSEDDADEPVDLESEVRDALEQSETHAIEDELEFGADLEFEDDEALGDAGDAQLLTRMTGADAPASMADVVGFLQDWYNLHRVRPAAKTVVPLLARLLASRDLFEFRRLLQILEAMDGGLTPATTVWLEKRLALIDRSIDDFRLRPSAR